MADNSDPRDALEAIFRGLQHTFKNHSRGARRKAWDATVSTRGRDEVDKLLNSPTRPLVGLDRLLSFREFVEATGWETIDGPFERTPHEALPPLPGGAPPVASGMIRLYRGAQVGELPHENAFFSDERGLKGIARAFARIPGRQLVYVDVPKEVAQAGLLHNGVTEGEYQIPEKYRRQVRIMK